MNQILYTCEKCNCEFTAHISTIDSTVKCPQCGCKQKV